MLTLIKKLDKWLELHRLLLVFLFAVVVLRLPNFFEPYWYGDEAIYLTIGHAINDGERLYADIIDHKTPIIYYLAAVPNQLSFRVLNLIWMMVTTIAFSAVTKKLLQSKLAYVIAMTLFVVLTTLPWFEGNLPNGELFVMGFMLVGLWILSHTSLFNYFLEKRKTLSSIPSYIQLVLAGVFFGLGILTKVPAVLDLAGILTIGWFAVTNHSFRETHESWLAAVRKVFLQLVLIMLGVLIPIAISILYFIAVGAGKEYLDFGLLYNFRYAGSWQLPFDQFILTKLFTLPGKLVLTTAVVVLLTIRRKWYSPAQQFIGSWFMLALVGSLLSNRPYPHYFQQIVPPLALLIGLAVTYVRDARKQLPVLLTSAALIGFFLSALILLKFAPYPTISYYRSFIEMITHKRDFVDYRNSFNSFMADNYAAAKVIKEAGVSEIFIWGTNPMLYALSSTQPTGRFTVSFHIKDFNAYQETMDSVRNKKPLFIVMMHEETTPLEGMEEYLGEHYLIYGSYEHFTLWKRVPDQMSHLL